MGKVDGISSYFRPTSLGMFTKLKKKIAEEEISSESSRTQPPSPALSRVSTRTSFTNGDVGRPLRAENKWEKRRLSNASLYGSRESLASERGSTISRHSSFARVSSSPALSPMAGEPVSARFSDTAGGRISDL